jgi:hypothetical protein
MPLTRGMIVGYDIELMTLRFTMVDPSARIIDCAISGSALDQLCGERRSAGPADRQIQFLKHRDTIEVLASTLFDARANARLVLVEIFAKHIRGGGDTLSNFGRSEKCDSRKRRHVCGCQLPYISERHSPSTGPYLISPT